MDRQVKKQKNNNFWILFLIGGIFFAIAVFITARDAKFKRDGVRVDAEIATITESYDSDNGWTKHFYVRYFVDGVEYVTELYHNETEVFFDDLYTGDTIPIVYLPEEPDYAVYAEPTGLPQIMFFVVAAICIVFGIIFLSFKRGGGKKLQELKQRGREIYAIIIKFDVKHNVRVLGRHPVNLECEDSSGRIFKCKFLFQSGDDFEVGDSISVFVDAINYKKYVVDIEGYLANKREKQNQDTGHNHEYNDCDKYGCDDGGIDDIEPFYDFDSDDTADDIADVSDVFDDFV